MGTVKAVAIISGDKNVRGSLQFIQLSTGVTQVRGRISGLSPGFHGFHIHALGDTTNGCNSTGPHFNPMKKDHGAPTDSERHAGDLGNIFAGPDGVAEVSIQDSQIPLIGQHSILGRAVVVHADPDDLGKVLHHYLQRPFMLREIPVESSVQGAFDVLDLCCVTVMESKDKCQQIKADEALSDFILLLGTGLSVGRKLPIVVCASSECNLP